tara:strand:+ start:1105 stop:1242 length:138 start_codon:yes stop_codon:yes gene_type:complete
VLNIHNVQEEQEREDAGSDGGGYRRSNNVSNITNKYVRGSQDKLS